MAPTDQLVIGFGDHIRVLFLQRAMASRCVCVRVRENPFFLVPEEAEGEEVYIIRSLVPKLRCN